MSVIIGGEGGLIVGGDFDSRREKQNALFLADMFASGGHGNLPYRSCQELSVDVAPDVSPEEIASICKIAGVEVSYG